MEMRSGSRDCSWWRSWWWKFFTTWLVCAAALLVAQCGPSEGRTTIDEAVPLHTQDERHESHHSIHQPPQRHERTRLQFSSPGNTSDEHPIDLEVSLSAFGIDFRLLLELNQYLVADSHQFHVVDVQQNTTESTVGAKACYYQGFLMSTESNDDTTWAAVSTCRGLSGSFYDGKDVYVVEPAVSYHVASLTSEHFVYALTDIPSAHEETSCGHPHLHGNKSLPIAAGGKTFLEKIARPSRVVRQAQWNGWRFVEMMFVIDHNMKAILGDRFRIQDFVLQATNVMDMIYKQIDMRIALTTVVLWSSGNPIRITAKPKETLDNFLRYRERHWLRTSNTPHDNAQLISSMDFEGATVGLGRLNSMCSTTGSGGISQHKSGHPASMVATVVAHEMGHNLNMQHDDERACNDCKARPCLMAATAGPRSTQKFSRCSREDKDLLIQSGGAHCLSNRPNKLFAAPVCGNGFREKGEECDCGSEQDCIDRCCTAKTCRLTPGSQCAGGECCQNCQFMRAGAMCRKKKNTCDLAEYCTGTGADCPNDSVYRNGLPCSLSPLPGNAYCWNGECVTIITQCRTLWGPQGQQAHDLCYDRLNTAGNQFGNCGKQGNRYLPCEAKDVLCGQLQCSAPPSVRYPVIGLSKRALQVVYRLGTQRLTCRQASVDLGSDIPDPGLAVDGTMCGTGRVCMAKRCVAVNSLNQQRCPVDAAGQECSGQGICDDRLRCHCRRGFFPPSCGRTRPPPNAPTAPGMGTAVIEDPFVNPNAPYGDGETLYPGPGIGPNGDTAPPTEDPSSSSRMSPGLIGGIAGGVLFFLAVVVTICCPGCVFAKCPCCRPKCLGGDQGGEVEREKDVPLTNRTQANRPDRKQPTPSAARRSPKQFASNGKHLLPVGSDLAGPGRPTPAPTNRVPINNVRLAAQRPQLGPPPQYPGRPALQRPPMAAPSSAPPPRPTPRRK